MKKVLVTGGTGFLGKHLIDALEEQGHEVTSFDIKPPLQNDHRGLFLQGDIRDHAQVLSAVRGCDTIFHLAAIPSIARAPYEVYEAINVIGTENVLRAARDSGVRKIVHVSSSTVYGIPEKCPLSETDAIKNVGMYGKSKIEAERLCMEFASPGLDISIIRPRVIMGAGRIGIFSILFDAILRNSPVYLIGKGENIFQFTGIQDMVNALLLAADHPATSIFNIGSNDRTVVHSLITALISRAGSSSRIVSLPVWLARAALGMVSLLGISPLSKEQFMIADTDFMLDTSRAKKELGWTSTQSNLDCLIEAFEWYKGNYSATGGQYKRLFGVLGKFRHSQQGAFQKNDCNRPGRGI